MVQVYPNWSNMVQNKSKSVQMGPNGSGITRSPGLVPHCQLFKVGNISLPVKQPGGKGRLGAQRQSFTAGFHIYLQSES